MGISLHITAIHMQTVQYIKKTHSQCIVYSHCHRAAALIRLKLNKCNYWKSKKLNKKKILWRMAGSAFILKNTTSLRFTMLRSVLDITASYVQRTQHTKNWIHSKMHRVYWHERCIDIILLTDAFQQSSFNQTIFCRQMKSQKIPITWNTHNFDLLGTHWTFCLFKTPFGWLPVFCCIYSVR